MIEKSVAPNEIVNIDEKHPLFVRISHWLNFPVLFVMMWSGLLIYWANDAYWPHLPAEFYDKLGISSRLAEGMAYHFAFMWVFAINCLIYLVYILYSGYWRHLFPNKNTPKEAFQVVLHDMKLSKYMPPYGKFNAAQRMAYTGVIFLGLLAILSGLAIYKPVQLYFLKNALGGYKFARIIHYLVAVSFFLFFFVHVAQVIRAGWNNFRAMVAGFEIRSEKPNEP